MHPHRQRVLCLLFLLLVLGSPPGNASPVWENRTHNLRETQMTAVAVDPHDPSRVYAGSARAVYRTTDGGRRWTEVLRLRGASTAVRRLAIDPTNARIVYAATEQGLYATRDEGRHWTPLFRGMNERERACDAFWLSAAHPAELWLGTRSGLFRSTDGGASWQREGSILGHAAIIDIAGDPHAAGTRYVLTDRGCYKTVDGGVTWDRLLVQAIVESDDPDDLNDLIDEATADFDPDAPPLFAHYLTTIALDPQQPAHLYVGSRRGLYVSEDGGVTWQRAPTTGILADRIDDVLVAHASPTMVYAATPLGVFQYDPARKAWQPLNQGLTARRAQSLSLEPTHRTLWTAAVGGLFTLDLSAGAAPLQSGLLADDILMTFRQEPTIRQVQEMAIRYAEVQPSKIAWWRREAALAGWLPSVNFGADIDRSSDDQFDEGTFPKFQMVKTYDRSFGWDVGVSWDLSKLIWNDDQTSIDSRSRLTTQLRNDILDQVNRFYYERRRLQSAMALEPAADMRAGVEQELQLQELTAQLDALTGGWFSRALAGQNK